VREQALLPLRQELPHSVAVTVDEWRERDAGPLFIGATLYVERDSQKGIVIGRRGEVLKDVGTTVRRELPPGTYLDLVVRVEHQWQRRQDTLDRLGY
jgi:GTP-binding protein Era